MSQRTLIDESYEHGVSCPVCRKAIVYGEWAVEIFEGLGPEIEPDTGFTPIFLLVCEKCGDRDDILERVAELE